jgi:hypothetical protein
MDDAAPPNRPDIDAFDCPLRREAFAFAARLSAGEMTPDEFQQEIAALMDRMNPIEALAGPISRALAERKHQVFYRRVRPRHALWMQLLYLAPDEVHEPHGHVDQVSNQALLHGRTYLREYDRVARLDSSTLLLRLRSDGWMTMGQRMQTTEIERNIHWFAASEEPAVQFNFVVAGAQSWLFDGDAARPKTRFFVDPTERATRDGLIVAREIDQATARAKFGGRRIESFTIPRAAA